MCVCVRVFVFARGWDREPHISSNGTLFKSIASGLGYFKICCLGDFSDFVHFFFSLRSHSLLRIQWMFKKKQLAYLHANNGQKGRRIPVLSSAFILLLHFNTVKCDLLWASPLEYSTDTFNAKPSFLLWSFLKTRVRIETWTFAFELTGSKQLLCCCFGRCRCYWSIRCNSLSGLSWF